MRSAINVISLVLIGTATLAHSAETAGNTTEAALVASTFAKAAAPWKARLDQDQTQRICSRTRDMPSSSEARAIADREATRVVMPADGSLSGQWAAGEVVAKSLKGGHFDDPPETINGGSCIACHQLDAASMKMAGTIGPSLVNYGRDRHFAQDAVKTAYVKIYDSNVAVPCSKMPRFGVHAVLSQQQITDVVAYLFDPMSPVNK
jgi:sulfur-oxidizing protein SoxX